ncbi:MAG: MFS transporter [Atopobiaceae bacterium]|nr:MFS transporter [Atopobiaceae bacterium]
MAEEQTGTEAPLKRRQMLALIGLVVAAFVFNTSEFMPVGLLSDIAESFSLTDAQAGIMISVYAWGVAALSLPLMVGASRFGFRELLLAVIELFAAGQVLSAVAVSYPFLILARLVVASAHAIFWSIVMICAARVAGPAHAAGAMSIVATGTSIAQIAGMPLGRAIGLAVGWRMAFALVGAVALIDLVFLFRVFPELAHEERFTLRRLPGLFHTVPLLVLFCVTVLLASGHYVAYGYIEPYLEDVASFSATGITGALALFGIAGLVASMLFGRLYAAHRKSYLAISCLMVAAALLALLPASGSPAAEALVLAAWSLGLTSFGIAFQALIIEIADPRDASVAMATYSGLYNLGIGCGTALGGAALDGLGAASLGLVGGGLALIGALGVAFLFLPLYQRFRTRVREAA